MNAITCNCGYSIGHPLIHSCKCVNVESQSQEDRIKELEKCAEYYRDKYYFDKPQTNAEPVAWMPIKSKHRMTEIKPDENDLHNWIPLYTTPQTKPRLSDEEIMKEIEKGDWYSLSFNAGVKFAEERILGK